MNDPRHPLTPAVQADICAFIRAGAFPQVAAEAAGIPVKVFETWMRCGRAQRPVPLYRDFYEAVRQAQAHARLAAESQALRRAPLSWLRFGPGRETKRIPGWTEAVKPAAGNRSAGPSLGRLQGLITAMLDALTPFPEARVAVAAALDTLEWLRDAGEESPPAVGEEQVAVPVEEPRPSPEVSAPASAIDPPPMASEPAAQAQPTDRQPPTNPHPTDNQPTRKSQPTGNEKAAAGPFAKPDTRPASRKTPWNPFPGFGESAWTIVASG